MTSSSTQNSMPPSPADIGHWLTGKVVSLIGNFGLEKILRIIGAIGFSAILAFWLVPSESWPLQAGVLVIDHTEFNLNEGEAKLVWPRRIFAWERFKIVGLPGGDIYFDAAGLQEGTTYGELMCADHRGCLAEQASIAKIRRNTLCLVAQNHENGDAWSLVFCARKRLSYLAGIRREIADLEARITMLKQPKMPEFIEIEWVSIDERTKAKGIFHSLNGDTLTIVQQNRKLAYSRLEKLSSASRNYALNAARMKTAYEQSFDNWRRETKRLNDWLLMKREILAAEGVELKKPASQILPALSPDNRASSSMPQSR